MRERIAVVAALVLCVVLIPAVVGAQMEKPYGKPRRFAWEFSPFVGADVFSKGGDIHLEDDWTYGARMGFCLGPRWEPEVSLSFVDDTRSTDRTVRDIDLVNLDLNMTANFNVLSTDDENHGRWIGTDRWTPYVTFGAGWVNADFGGYDSDEEYTFNAGFGTRVMMGRTSALRMEVRGRAVPDAGYEELLPTMGISWIMGGKALRDSDADTVLDPDDRCPGTTLGCTVDKFGCPSDTDGDTVCDGIDQCPDTPRGCYVDARGCPLDSDGDTVCDGLDNCPGTPTGCWVDESGCPKDSDGDTVCDGVDRCPDTKKGCVVDRFGCPVDSDGDGVCDGIDECPNTPRGQKVDERGCPVVRLVLADVYFEFNKSVIRDFYYPFLDAVAGSLQADNNLSVVIELDGHTDSIGSFEYNYRLGERRAKAVKEYLVAQGIDPNRLVGVSLGETKPIASNATEDGRAHNRRVEMVPRGPNLDPSQIDYYKVVLKDAYFETDKATLRPEARTFLADIARAMVDPRFEHVVLELQGFADKRGSEKHNDGLSVQRAEAVKAFLVEEGLSPDRISTVGYGEAKSRGAGSHGWQQDRRVEVHAKP